MAVCADHPVGVDVEFVRGLPVDSSLWDLVLGKSETASDAAELYAHWVRKEAVVKATRHGLRVPLNEVMVDPGGRIVGYPALAPVVGLVVDVDFGPGYAGALAVLAVPTVPTVPDGAYGAEGAYGGVGDDRGPACRRAPGGAPGMGLTRCGRSARVTGG